MLKLRKRLSSPIVLAAASLLLFAAGQAPAQTGISSNTATLAVSATVTGSLQLTLATATGGISLGGTSTAATLSFGTTLNEYGTPPTNATIVTNPNASFCTACFAVYTPIDVVVTAADLTSSNFTLKAYVTSYSGSEKLSLDGTTALSTTSPGTTVTASGNYAGAGSNQFNVYLGVPTASSGAATYNDTINFVAVSN